MTSGKNILTALLRQAGGDHRHEPRGPERTNGHGDLRPHSGTVRGGVGRRRRDSEAKAEA